MCNTNNNKRLLLRIYIENSYKSIRKAVVQINEKRWTGTSSTRILTWPMCIWNGTRLHYSSGKPEWKPLWSTTKSSRIAKLKNYAMLMASPNVAKDVENWYYHASGSVTWHKPSGKLSASIKVNLQVMFNYSKGIVIK